MSSDFKKRLVCKFLNTTACFVVVAAFSHEVFAAPEGGVITAGSAAVSQAGLDTVIQQNSNRAIIRWNSFDVAQNEKVTFQQPSANSITINRITDTKSSRIDGNISANGKLVMINPNGIVFGATSRVDVGSLVATTSDIEDDVAFMAGGPAKFTKSGKSDAKIINAGTITARDAGLVGLVAPNVENSGVIQAKLGKVQLASGDIHTIDLAGDGLIKIEISDNVLSQSVKNTGTIQADGGEVLMTAAQGRAALDAVISNHGRIQTGTIFATDGKVVKRGKVTMTAATTAGKSKTKVVNGGTIVADGGTVQMIADTVNLQNTSTISVASDNGGGAVYIGGARQGGSSLPTAQFVNVEAGSIIDASALKQGNGGEVILWSDLQTNFGGKIISTGGSISGNGGEVEVSSKGRLNYVGFTDLTAKKGKMGNLLLDPTDILISSAADQNISGSSPFTSTVDDGPSVLSAATLMTALASASVTVQTSATGTQQGNITVNAPISWSSGNTLTLDAHNNIIINNAIAGQNLTLIAGNDTQIGAALTGTGTLTIMTKYDSQTMGIGSTSSGTLQLNTSELNHITNGWNQLVFGRSTGSAVMEVRAATWSDNVLLRSDTGIIHIAGVQNMGTNNLSITTNSDLSITSQLTGSGTLSISSLDPSVGIGVGTGQAGALQLSNSDLSFIINGWGSVVFGDSALTADLNVGAYSWFDNLVLQTGTGTLSINGTQNLGANNLQIIANSNPVIAADLIGTGSLTFQPGSAGLTVGVGSGASGVFNIDASEFAHIKDGWDQIYLGRIDSNALMDLRALSWLDRIRIYSGAGMISINGAQNFGANQAVFQTDGDIEVNAALSGTGQLAFLSNASGTSIGLAGEAGTINLSTAELNQIQNGFNLIQFGSTGFPYANPMMVGTYTWQDNVMFSNSTGTISFTGAQNFGANNLTIRTDADLDIAATLTGTGVLNIFGQSAATTIGLGTGQAGTLALSDTDISNIMDGWSNIIIGRSASTGGINVGAQTWNDQLELQSGTGIITISGAQNMGANNLTLTTSSDIAINAGLVGTGTITIQGTDATTTIGVGTAQAGALALDATDLANITNGWSDVIIGRTDGSGAMNVGANVWNDNLTLQSLSGVITISGTQTMGANNLTISTAADAAINGGLTGTGILNLRGAAANTTIGLGTGQAGTFQLDNTDLGNITNGWSDIIIGRTDGTGAITAGANTWNDNLTLQSSTGVITVAGVQTMGANTLTISTDAAAVINAGLTGTGTLNLRGNSANTTMGFGTGQPGSFFFDTTAVGNITNGWSNIVIGRTDGTGDINIGALTWNDNLTLQSNTGSIIIGGIQTLGANNVTFNTDGDPQINAAMNSTGILTFQGLTDATTIGVGTGQAGTLAISTADLNNADNTWSSIVIGRTTQTGAINAGGFTLVDPLTLQSGTGVITIGAAINVGANNMTIQTDADPIINATLTGTGNLNILPMSNGTTIGVGTGQAGTISIDDAEQARFVNGWGNIVIGRTTGNGAINLGSALTWNDNLFLRTTGAVTVNGTQNFVNNTFSIQTDSDPTFNGTMASTGTFSLTQIATGVSMGLGDGQAGTVNLTDAELNNILNGWTSLVFGLTNATADLNIGAYTWQDNTTLRTGSGVLSINGAQNTGSNNLTLATDGNVAINAALTGTGTLAIMPNGNISMGIGTGQAGTIQLSDAELANITNGWLSLVFGTTTSTALVNVGAQTWNDNVTIRSGSGVMTIAGAQNTGSNNLTLLTDSNLVVNAALTGSGTLTIAPNTNTIMGIGTGQTGTLSLTDAELNRITDGWNNIVLGSTASTAAVNVGLRSWNDNLTLNSGSGVMTIAAAQSMGANNLTIQTDNNLVLNGNISGTGILTIRGASNATSIGLGNGQTGVLNLTDAEILRIVDGWTRIDFGHTASTGVMNLGAATWFDPLKLITNTGVITVNGVQTLGANNLDISTNADPTFNAALKGTGTLSIYGTAATTSIGIGDGQVGTLQLSNSDLAYLSNGWNSIIFGSNTQTGVMNIGSYNWQYDTTFRTGSGQMTIAGATNTGPRNITLETDSNLAINAAITGTGTLTIRGSAAATGMGIGTGQAGGLSLTDAELNQLTDGWLNIVFGRAASTGAVNVGAKTWNDSVQVISGTGQMTIAGVQNLGANNLTLETDSNLAINAALNGTGKLAIRGSDMATTIGVNGAAGTLALSTAEIANITDGWGSVMIGRHDMMGAISLGTATWLNPTTFMTRGDVNISGVQTSTETGGNSLVFVSQSGAFTNTAGASAINAGGGRYLIYAVDVASTTLGGLTPTAQSGNTYFSLYPADVVQTGDVIVYSTGAPKVLLIQIDDKSKVYGDANPTFTYTFLGGLQGSDTLSGALTGYTLDASGTSLTDNAGTTWAITGSFLTGLGYSTNVINGTLTVTKAPVLVQAAPSTRTYGAANPAYTINYIGLKNGETSSVIDTLATASTTANLLSNVGTYNVTTSGASDTNYVFNYAPGTMTVTKATLTVTADNKTREYGDANPAFTLSYSGFLNGDTSSGLTSLPTATTLADNTTSPSAVAITLSGGTDNNYSYTFVNGTLTITKANLTVTADNKTRVYGNNNPTLSYTFGAFKNGETSAVLASLPTVSTTATNTTNVGTAVISVSGGSDANYNYVFTNGTMTIGKSTLTATPASVSREYGDANPTFVINYSGFKNTDDASVLDTSPTVSTSATSLTNVGTYVLSASGGLDDNYDIAYVTGVLTITKANLSVVADNKTREYGDANPALTYTFGSFKNGQTAANLTTLPTLSTTATATTGVGTSAITLTGGSDANYNFVITNGTLTITKATLTATAQNATREYGDANPTLGVVYTGFKNGETFSVIDTLATPSTTATNTTNAGTAVISASGANDDNYNFTYVNGTLTISKANLAVTADNKTREYGDANPVLTYTFGSFKNGETSAVLGTAPTISTTATGTTGVGTAAITLAGGSDTNYNYVMTNGTLTITKATLTATAQNATRDYGDANPTLGVVYTGFKNGETFSVIDTLATPSTTATNTTNAGTSVISASGASDDNYDFTYVNGTLTINKANLSVVADNKTREYGDANPALTYTFGTFKNGETSAVLGGLPTISTTATNTTNVGTAAINLAGGSDTNYNYVFTNGTLTITKADLAITADNKTREYGDANPALTYTFGSFKNGETSTVLGTAPTISTSATGTTNVGTAAIVLAGGSDGNYNYVLTNGVLTITKATLTATAQNAIREYGDANPTLGVVYTGFKNGETFGVIDTLATASTTATNTTNAGTAVISATGANDNNYDFVYANGTLTIAKANLSVIADNKTREYGDANPALTYTFGSFKNGETSAVLGGLPTISTTANATTNAGTAAITLSGGSDANYNYVFTDGALTITKAALTVQIDDATRAEGAANPAYSYTILSGLKNGDSGNLLSNVIYSSGTNKFSPRGTYVLNGSGGVATNYYVSTYTPGTLTITPGELPIQALPSTVYYSNTLGIKESWDQWRDLLYYEDDDFLESILFGRKVIRRDYHDKAA